MSKWLIKNARFITMDEKNPYVEGHMIVEGDRITYIGEQLPDAPDSFTQTYDGKHRLIMPGLINTHNHAPMSLLRGFADDLALQVWLEEKMWPNEAKFTEQDVEYGTKLSIIEMLKSGTTCYVDMYDRMDVVATCVEQAGIRASLTRGIIGFGGREVQDEKLNEAKTFAKNWHGKADGRITTMMSPHSPYTCTPDYIERIVEAAHELSLPIHTHLSETKKEVDDHVQQYGIRPVEHLMSIGVFSRPCLVAHAVHLNDEEIEILREHQVHVSHNPSSNLKLASGIARVPDLLEAGVNVAIGTDSSASNNNLDMFDEMRLAALIHKGASLEPTVVPAMQTLRMATVNGALALSLPDIGRLEVGMKADFIAIDIDLPHFYPHHQMDHFVSHLVYSAVGSDVTDVWVDGKQVVRDRQVLTLDEEKVKREFQSCFKRLIS